MPSCCLWAPSSDRLVGPSVHLWGPGGPGQGEPLSPQPPTLRPSSSSSSRLAGRGSPRASLSLGQVPPSGWGGGRAAALTDPAHVSGELGALTASGPKSPCRGSRVDLKLRVTRPINIPSRPGSSVTLVAAFWTSFLQSPPRDGQ